MKSLLRNLLTGVSVILLILLATTNSFAQWSTDSTKYTFDGVSYDIQTGNKGGKYFITNEGIKYYPPKATNKIYITENQTAVEYKGTSYPIHIGSKGGKYIIVGQSKKYLTIK